MSILGGVWVMFDRIGQRARQGGSPSGVSLLMALAVWVLIIGPAADGQDRAIDFVEKPILVLDTGGHHAPVRRLIFTKDESRLLSAGDDKVVRVWDITGATPTLGWTIRPRIWRGSAGAINALALTPPDAQGRQTLALAGFGIESYRGEIGLYRFPGAFDRRQGDVEAYLAAGDAVPLLQTKGHVNPVACLAFDPGGTILASGGVDRTVRIWDFRNRAQIAVLAPPDQGTVNALAFTPNGLRLATGGSDGILRVWNVQARPPVLEAQAAPLVIRPNDPDGLAINALDISPDGRSVVIGREDGALLRYDLANLAGGPIRSPVNPRQGAVEALAFAPDGRLATSLISQRLASAGDRPTVACDIEIRRSVDLAVTEAVARSSNLVYALAFSPGGKYLAFAGGDQQDIRLKDLRNPAAPMIELSASTSRGASLWDVGFVGDLSVAYSFVHPEDAPPAAYWGFNLKDRSRASFATNEVRRAIPTLDGWSVRPAGPFLLEVLRAGAVAFRLELSPLLDGRWWSYSFVPPGPKHARPTLAVACQRGVAVYRLEDGLRTRFLDGHAGAVYALAPSPDGKWLATGSSDQTLRLWSLADSDVIAPLGAEFERRDGVLTVRSVEPGGFAEVAGLQARDRLDQVALGGKVVTPDEFLAGVDDSPPNSRIEFKGVRRRAGMPDEPVLAGTTKRDRPVLSLFVGLDREWVLWTPRGFYDASVLGDSTFLGWLVNRSTLANPRPTDFYPLVTHEKALRQPRGVPGNLIDQLLDAADESVVLGPRPTPAEQTIEANRPSVVTAYVGQGGAAIRDRDGRAIAPGSPLPEGFAMDSGVLAVDWKVETWKAGPPGPFELRVNGQTVRPAQVPPLDPAAGVATVPMRYPVEDSGSFAIMAMADRAGPSERRQTLTATVNAPPRPRPGRLRLLAIAPTFTDTGIPPIGASARDAGDLSRFFARHLVTEAGQAFGTIDPDGAGLVGGAASAEKVLSSLESAAKGPIERGDLAVVVIETHLVTRGQDSRLAVADSRGVPPDPMTTVPAESISAALESLVRRGCKVVLVLDGVHESPGGAWQSDAVEWARRLRNDHDVITVLATTRRPIRDEHVGVHRPLAQAILDSIQAPRRRLDDPLLSLADFRKVVLDGVQKLTLRKGEPMVYIPAGIDPGFPFLTRKPKPVEAALGR